MKTVKRGEEKDSGGNKEEIANDENHCSEVSVVPSLSSFLLRTNASFQVLELSDQLVCFC